MKLAVKSCLIMGGSGCLKSEVNSISEDRKGAQSDCLAAAATRARAVLRKIERCIADARSKI